MGGSWKRLFWMRVSWNRGIHTMRRHTRYQSFSLTSTPMHVSTQPSPTKQIPKNLVHNIFLIITLYLFYHTVVDPDFSILVDPHPPPGQPNPACQVKRHKGLSKKLSTAGIAVTVVLVSLAVIGVSL